MRQQPMITEINTKRSKDVEASTERMTPGPTEEPVHESEKCNEMDENNQSPISNFNPPCAVLCQTRARSRSLEEASYRHQRAL